MDSKNLRSVTQFCDENPAFTPGSIRGLIFNASNNGLTRYEAIARIGRRVYIDPARFNVWLKDRQEWGG